MPPVHKRGRQLSARISRVNHQRREELKPSPEDDEETLPSKKRRALFFGLFGQASLPWARDGRYALDCMILSRIEAAGLKWAALLLVVGLGGTAVGATAPLSAEQIVQKTVERAAQSKRSSAPHGYTYTKVNVTEELDGKGNVRQRKQRVFQVDFRNGTTSVKLVEVDGHRPAEADLKFQAETQSNMHQMLGQGPGGRDNFLTPETATHFDFTLLGQEWINGRPSYEIAFQPKSPQVPVRHLVDRLLNRVSGTLWIDQQEYEIARADLKLDSEVDLLGGLIGCLRKLAYTMTRTRVADGVWLHSFSSGDFEGRKLLDSMRIKTKSESMNFHVLGG
jgi:hypothetical protein